ncbi:hypothetical protein CKAH01_10639 [Colletotrichum kahawae]|uniref:DUF6546 domain-containing protein n=1 Tax=Colletotrichum kahawae TaxID=34407 RepID=A0AAE0CYL3_COLKA|nr:hypothetical protein CKAH01_10639 [Colletotrichum kahawae]
MFFSSQDDVPLVKAVTKFIIRRQCRRQIDSEALGYLFNRLPRLHSVVYEPWLRPLMIEQVLILDSSDLDTIKYHLPRSLKRISIFKSTDECVLRTHRFFRSVMPGNWRSDSPTLAYIFAKRSLEFEKLSVAFFIEANDFFQSCQREWIWERLSLLCLTTRTLTQTNRPDVIASTLKNAAAAALSMPCLHTMALWNSFQGEACKFIYCAESGSTSLSWKGTFNLHMEQSMIHDWQKVAQKYTRYNLQIVQEPEILVQVESHSHAVELLELPVEVVDPISLLQMRKEEQFGRH